MRISEDLYYTGLEQLTKGLVDEEGMSRTAAKKDAKPSARLLKTAAFTDAGSGLHLAVENMRGEGIRQGTFWRVSEDGKHIERDLEDEDETKASEASLKRKAEFQVGDGVIIEGEKGIITEIAVNEDNTPIIYAENENGVSLGGWDPKDVHEASLKRKADIGAGLWDDLDLNFQDFLETSEIDKDKWEKMSKEQQDELAQSYLSGEGYLPETFASKKQAGYPPRMREIPEGIERDTANKLDEQSKERELSESEKADKNLIDEDLENKGLFFE